MAFIPARISPVATSAMLLLFTLAGGCAPREHVPPYHWTDDATALRDLAARARAVHTASAQCQITLTRPDGQSVRLDGALVMQPPDRVRLRAWKLGQAVFDLTIVPQGVWMVLPEDPQSKQRIVPAGASAAEMARAWALFSGGFFAGSDALVTYSGGPRFHVVRWIEGKKVDCEVERATLTPRRYVMSDSSGLKRFTLELQNSQMIGNIAWPTNLIARSENGTISLQLHDVELNAELPSAAFIPPRRAEKM
jgi:outer membrane lipoprotein-sorting protein